MAEFIQFNIEEMLPELEQMARIRLFSGAETRAILKKRKAYEYKLKRQNKQKTDFLQYIQYEMSVLNLVRTRRKKMGCYFKRVEIDVAIVQRIHLLFKLVVRRFPHDLKLWLSHIEFCKKRKEKATVGQLFSRMLQVHSRNPSIWIMAAKWEMEDNLSMDNARSFLQRGLRFNSGSQQLWQEYFRMELLNADKLCKRREMLGVAGMEEDTDTSNSIIQGAVAQVVFKKAIDTFPHDVPFWLSFLPICRLFQSTQHVEQFIIQELYEKHRDNELTLDAVAKRKLAEIAQLEKSSEQKKKHKVISRIEDECWKEFDKAVEQMPTEKMWILYLKACIGQLSLKSPKNLVVSRLDVTLSVFKRAAAVNKLSRLMFEEWVRVLCNTGQVEEAEKVLVMATERYPDSAQLWRLQLSCLLQWGSPYETVMPLAHTCFKQVPDKESLPIWHMLLDWCMLNKPEAVEALLESGLSRKPEVCVHIKERYLEWALVQQGMDQARLLYQRLAATKPVSLEFYKKYINLEKSQASPKMKKLRRAFEDALQEYGQDSVRLWLDYIQLEFTHPKGKPENAGNLHWRALKALRGQLVEQFVTEYTLMQTGHLDE